MNYDETLTIMSVLKAAYPSFYKNMSRSEAEGIVALWSTMFADDPVEMVALAVKSHIAGDVKGFPPHIGAIKEALYKLKVSEAKSEMDAWNLVKQATRNGIYGAEEEFNKLPGEIQKLVGSASQIKEWAMMDSETLNSVVASNFMRSYKVITARNKELATLPGDVRNAMAQIAAGFDMKALEEKTWTD